MSCPERRALVTMSLLFAVGGCCGSDTFADVPQAQTHPLDVAVVYVSREQDSRELGVEAQGRELRPGGKLRRLETDGSVRDLVTSPELHDVARPSVSFNGQWVAFAAIRDELDYWGIYRVPVEGGVAEQLTAPTINPVQDFIDTTERVDTRLSGVGDFAPVWLPDGRIAFLSTRYPTLAASCGERMTNVYVMTGDGSEIHRISTSRSGIVDPAVLQDGRIVAAYYRDNMNEPLPEGSGLRPIVGDRHWQDRYWMLWAMNPDGTGASRYANITGGVDGDHEWGVHQPREMAGGDLVAAVRSDATLIDMKAYKSGIARFPPGYVQPREVTGFGSLFGNGDGNAMCPEPLPDGRILLSYGARAASPNGHEVRGDFDLYVIDGDLDAATLQPVVIDAGTDELDAVAIVERHAEVIHDTLTATPSNDPRVNEGSTATLINEDIYADLPLRVMERLSPKPYSVASVVFYDDSQQFHYDDNPQLSKQMPTLLSVVPVAADGSFTAEVPADRPFFFHLVTHTDVGARTQYTPVELDGAWPSDSHFVTVHDFLRPGTEARCRGCHAGHMLDAQIAMDDARVNLARMANVWHEDHYPTAETHILNAPFRAIDQRLARGDNTLGWIAQENPALYLFWQGVVVVDEVVLHPLISGSELTSIRLTTEGGTVEVTTPLRSGDPPLTVALGGHATHTLSIELEGDGLLGFGEVVVHGSLPDTWPEAQLRAPVGLAIDPNFNLTWEPLGHAAMGGYQLHVLDEAGQLLQTHDIGLVTRHTKQLGDLEQGQTVCLQLQAYDVLGRLAGASSDRVCGDVPALRVDSIEPASLRLGEVVEVTVQGEGFRQANDIQLSLGGFKLLDFTVVDSQTLRGKTRPDRPRESGAHDVAVSYDSGLQATLEGGITFTD
jgi:hypothetical protein